MAALAMPAGAQVCADDKHTESGDFIRLDCDMRYRDTVLSCTDTYEAEDKDGKKLQLPSIFPACPKEPMPKRQTEKLAFPKAFTPYLYDYLRDPEDETLPYSGYIARGTTGDPSQTFSVIGNAPKGVTRQKGCVNQIELTSARTPEERAKLIRLQLDNCANQFILNAAPYPFHKVGSNLACATKDDPTRRCQQEDMCQPLRMRVDTRQEYMADTYIRAAWQKLLQNPGYRKTPGAPKEPHLPTGLTLKNPIPVSPAAEQQITLSAIAMTEYEEILDPSHPFSPRWDFRYNERDHYSPMVEPYQSKYHDDSKAVYCAGNRADTGDKEKDKEYKVDVLEFRHERFNKHTTNRIGYNTACYKDKGTQTVPMTMPPAYILPTPQFTAMVAGAFCYRIIAPPIPSTPFTPGFSGIAQRVECWEGCYRLKGKVDDTKQLPPCTTRYDSKDLSISAPNLPGGRNRMQRDAACMLNPGEKKVAMSTLCKELRAPYAPLNKLKMRYHNPDGEEEKSGGEKTVVLTHGVQEGLWHKEYFDDHMPYPRLWDVGSSIQKSTATDQDPNDDLGQYTAIVGVGHESSLPDDEPIEEESGDGEEKKEAKKIKDERCLYGGWGDDVNVGGLSISIPDPVTSWTELKLYQANTIREANIVCIGRYEKAFKHRSPENQLLVSAGAVRTGIVKQECELDDQGHTIPDKCKSKEVGEEEEGEEDASSGTGSDEKKWTNLQYIQDSMPLGWRGYMGTIDEGESFAQLFGGGATITGLDNAQCGDVLLLPYGGGTKGDAKKRGLPKVARVNCEAGEKKDGHESAVRQLKGKTFVEVQEADNGKWPDVCGTTDVLGEVKTRRLFKPGQMRPEIVNELKRAKWTQSCIDSKLTECEMEQWGSVKLYRPVKDLLDGEEVEDEEEGGTP